MEKAFEKLSKLKVFTFQYGSIQISAAKRTQRITSIFTFQYGSIQIHTAIASMQSVIIYIPIWFYSNKENLQLINIEIYDLHSNMVLFK